MGFLLRLSGCLQELVISNNRLTTLNSLRLLPNLQLVNAERNQVREFPEIQQFLEACRRLSTLKLAGNPFVETRAQRLWRHPIVFCCPSITELSETAVAQTERNFVEEKVKYKKKHGQSWY